MDVGWSVRREGEEPGKERSGGARAARGVEGAGPRAAVARQEGSEAGRGGEAAGAAGEGVAQVEEGEVRWRYEGMRDELWGEQVAREGDLVEDDVDGVGVLCDGGEWIVFDGGKRRERTLMARRAGAGDADSSAPEGWAGRFAS